MKKPKSSLTEFLTEGDLENKGIASRRTLQAWRLLGRGPKYYKLATGHGGRGMVRYKWSDVEVWLNARAVAPPTSQGSSAALEGVR